MYGFAGISKPLRRRPTPYPNCKWSKNCGFAKVSKTSNPYKIKVLVGGDGGTRTPDPLHAKQVLYQLSYIPIWSPGHAAPFDSAQGDTAARRPWATVEDCTCRRGHLSKRMRYVPRSFASALAAVVLLCTAMPARAAAPILVAANRCNSQTIDQASSRIRDYDRHGPGGSTARLVERFGAIAEVIATLNEERDILDSICSSDAQRSPLFTQIATYSAWGLALESDVAAKLNASCAAAATALPTIMLADAWLALARVVNEDGGAVPASFADVIPKVQTRAAAVGLTLPAWADTSAYWADQVRTKAKAAIATCPTPSTSPSPSTPQGDKGRIANSSQIGAAWEPGPIM